MIEGERPTLGPSFGDRNDGEEDAAPRRMPDAEERTARWANRRHHPRELLLGVQDHEPLRALPAFWQVLYGDFPGYVALLSGLRTGPRLAEVRTAFVRWPEDVMTG